MNNPRSCALKSVDSKLIVGWDRYNNYLPVCWKYWECEVLCVPKTMLWGRWPFTHNHVRNECGYHNPQMHPPLQRAHKKFNPRGRWRGVRSQDHNTCVNPFAFRIRMHLCILGLKLCVYCLVSSCINCWLILGCASNFTKHPWRYHYYIMHHMREWVLFTHQVWPLSWVQNVNLLIATGNSE
jgi:hypothetical protein